MAIQISIPRKNGGTPIYSTAFVYTSEAILKFSISIVEAGWAVYADKTERDNSENPLYVFGTRFRFQDIGSFTQATLKGKIDQALKDLCSAEASDPAINASNRIPPRLRDAIIAGSIVAD